MVHEIPYSENTPSNARPCFYLLELFTLENHYLTKNKKPYKPQMPGTRFTRTQNTKLHHTHSLPLCIISATKSWCSSSHTYPLPSSRTPPHTPQLTPHESSDSPYQPPNNRMRTSNIPPWQDCSSIQYPHVHVSCFSLPPKTNSSASRQSHFLANPSYHTMGLSFLRLHLGNQIHSPACLVASQCCNRKNWEVKIISELGGDN